MCRNSLADYTTTIHKKKNVILEFDWIFKGTSTFYKLMAGLCSYKYVYCSNTCYKYVLSSMR